MVYTIKMQTEEKPFKKPITHEERLELATKLDRELDEFIEKLPRKKYDEGWPEDRWEEVRLIDNIFISV